MVGRWIELCGVNYYVCSVYGVGGLCCLGGRDIVKLIDWGFTILLGSLLVITIFIICPAIEKDERENNSCPCWMRRYNP